MAVGTVGWGKMTSFFCLVTPPPQQQQQPVQEDDKCGRKRRHVDPEQSLDARSDLDVDNRGDNVIENEKKTWESIDHHPRRKMKLNYLTGGYDSATEICSDGAWIVDGETMVDFLKQYRDVSMAGAEKLKNISDDRILSLSFIFLFTIDRNSSCTHHLEPDHHLAILEELNYEV
ncbi:unnamed protein product [Absidia cylindrospora]